MSDRITEVNATVGLTVEMVSRSDCAMTYEELAEWASDRIQSTLRGVVDYRVESDGLSCEVIRIRLIAPYSIDEELARIVVSEAVRDVYLLASEGTNSGIEPEGYKVRPE